MKKRIKALVISFFFFLFVFSIYVYAVEMTPSPESSDSASKNQEIQQIEDLKQKIATKVAQLKEKNNKAVSGYITEINGNIIKIKDGNEPEYVLKLDDTITKYFEIVGAKKKEIKLSDLDKGQYIIASGLLTADTMETNFVYVDLKYLIKSGKVFEINNEQYYFKVIAGDNEKYTLDIERSTKKFILNIKSLELEKVGFSKIKVGDTVHFVIKEKKLNTENSRFSASRIVIIPQEYFLK